jgi:cytochrome P450
LGAALIGAGADTTASFIQSLVLALVNFPEIQTLAQKEIDCIVGDERAPVVDDIERLPYIQAVIKEASSKFIMRQNISNTN